MAHASDSSATALIFLCCVVGLFFAFFQFTKIRAIEIISSGEKITDSLMINNGYQGNKKTEKLKEIYEAIREGAYAFLYEEYKICAIFVLIFSMVIFGLVSWGEKSAGDGALTTVAFIVGAVTSIISGYIGMMVAVYSNVRTTVSAQNNGWKDCFNVAFRAGGVMGFTLCSLGILVLYVLLLLFKTHFNDWELMMDCISGYGLGGSSIAMFGRVGGGIYTKAADVGADLVGKVIHGIPEDDPRNPATIADNVGDNVGDVAGMGADLFGSFAESTCAALVIAATSNDLLDNWPAVVFPLLVSSVGILVCMFCSFIATHINVVTTEPGVEHALKVQLISTTLLMIPAVTAVALNFLPSEFSIVGVAANVVVTPTKAIVCVSSGAVGGLVIGLITEYYTSHSYTPVREVADSCKTGAATNIIYGLALGYKSDIIPVFVLAGIIYISFTLADLYGVALGAVGMLSTLATGLTIDAYGPVCDNAGGIAEMAQLDPKVREKTDALDAAGNTTAAIGKGFAIGSAALVSLALFGAFVTRINTASNTTGFSGVNVLQPIVFAFLLIGAMLPYWFSALTMKSVGLAAMGMVEEIKRQYAENPRLLDENSQERPDYTRCVAISTDASLKEMIAPAALVMLAPLITGTLFGVFAVYGLLTGGLVSAVQMAISMSNTGGAWDNAKKYIEKASPDSELKGKGSDIHKAAVVGDTVGDPLKDTSGPALNILMKLMAILSLVFAKYFYHINHGKGVFQVSAN